VLFEWHTLGNIGLKETYAGIPKSSTLDISHVNSVYEENDHNLLVSARDLHSALELDRQTGKILFRLGGKVSDYTMGKGTQFIGQHDIRRAPDDRMTIFDNGAPPSPGRAARALVLSVNDSNKSVKLSRQFRRPDKLHSPSQGNVQGLANGNFMVGWGGDTPFFDEYTPSGKVALDGHIDPQTLDSYRVWRFPWTGNPTAPPDAVAINKNGKTTVYVSWNGATEVAKWEVDDSAGMQIKTLAKRHFETTIHLPTQQTQVKVKALDSHGTVLKESKLITPTTG
jgi:hypothetical protein